MTRYVIHEVGCDQLFDRKQSHCTCDGPSPEELAELVRISEAVRRELELAGLKGMEASLYAALIPFTKENQ